MPRKHPYYGPEEWPVTGTAYEQPWLRWDNEPEETYAKFQCFRDLPPPRRTLYNAYLMQSGKPWAGQDRHRAHDDSKLPSSWDGQARKWHWRERAERFDIWKEKSQLEAERDGSLEAWKEMGERHAREAMALQQKALERLRTMNPAELSASEVRQFLVQAATLERLARVASLQDMARVQREKEEEAAREGVAVITYVDDWRGDSGRLPKRNPDSYYGNGQGALPELKEGTDGGRPLRFVTPRGTETPIPLPTAAPRAGRRAPRKAPVHVPGGGQAVAEDDHGDDPGGGGGDPG